MIYNIQDCPRKWYEWLIYPLQMVCAVFVATVLIANICGTPVSSCLVGAMIGTLIYQAFTKFKSPMFISSCGATVSAVIGALGLGNCGANYLAVIIGGCIIAAIYGLFALITYKFGAKVIDKILPPTIVGSITLVIGINLAGFIPTYVHANSITNNWEILIAIITMLTTAIVSHYGKGFIKNIPFLFGLVVGYIAATIFTVTGIAPIIDFSVFKNINHIFALPDFTFLHLKDNVIDAAIIGQVVILFVPVAICSFCEHLSDHRTLSNIIDVDLTKEPGLHRTLIGDGVASAVGTVVCGLPNTSYGESIATIGFSKVASVWVTTVAALIIGMLGFIQPFQVLLSSVPSCVFGGCAMILYGYIAASGLKTLMKNKIDLEDNKNLIVVSVILTVGVSGIWLFNAAFAGVSLAMVLGIILNLILRPKHN